MPVELTIVESVTELETTVVEVILESASEPGPAGPGVPTGGTAGQVLTKDSGTDYDTSWQDSAGGPGGGAPTDVDYLVGTASGDLSAEIVVGTSPGGELGGTWASPTVDATHSGSSHAAVQAAAEATAAAALASHEADTTGIHGITDTSALALTANVQPLDSDLTAIAALSTSAFGRGLLELVNQAALLSAAGAAAASHAHAGEDITSGTVADARIASTIARDSEVTAAVSAHEADTTSVHGIADTSALALTANAVMDGDTAGGVLSGTYPNPGFASDMATQAELDAHESDTSNVHGITDTSALYRSGGTDVALADGGTGASLVDPNADRVLFWDDSAGAVTWLTMGTNLTITNTTLDAAGGSGTDLGFANHFMLMGA